MIILIMGYFLMSLIFLVFRFFYHILPKKSPQENLIQAIKNDFVKLFFYVKQIILSHPTKIKIIVVLVTVSILLPLLQLPIKIFDILEDFLCAVNFFIFVMIFAPQANPSKKGFPVEIFGFIYSVIFMYYSAGVLVFDIFYTDNSFNENMWIYGYIVTIISYVVCIATLSRLWKEI